jgi:hypothetical protein
MTRPTCSSKKSGWRNERGVAMEARRTAVNDKSDNRWLYVWVLCL